MSTGDPSDATSTPSAHGMLDRLTAEFTSRIDSTGVVEPPGTQALAWFRAAWPLLAGLQDEMEDDELVRLAIRALPFLVESQDLTHRRAQRRG